MKSRNTSPGQIPEPTKSELEILQALWERGPSTVRTVNDALNEHRRDVNYSTHSNSCRSCSTRACWSAR